MGVFTPAALLPFDKVRHSTDWQRWGELAKDAPPFLAPEFFALIRPLAASGEQLVAEAWNASRMLGALPLLRVGDTLRGLRSDHSPCFDFCGDDAAITAIWSCLRHDPTWTELVFDKVPSTSLLATRLPELAKQHGYPCVLRPDHAHPYFALPGFDARMPAKFRSNVHRCARKAAPLELERIAIPTHADLEAAAAIEAMAWKGAVGTAISSDHRVAHIYEAFGRLFGRRGRASLYFLRASGVRIATLFSIEDHRTLFALKIGFDPAYANVSPGHLLIWKVAADAEQRGLLELDFVGHEDEWKRKWTNQTHAQVAIRIYRRSLRGLTRYNLREVVKPRLPEPMRSTPKSPLPRSCQRADLVGDHTLKERIKIRVARGLGIKSRIRALWSKPAEPKSRLGAPSKFPEGSWVRVLPRAPLAAVLDERERTRGLLFVPTQYETCGEVFRVQHHVRRLRDDHGKFRPVHRTVLLEGADCGGRGAEPAGCGRHCPLMYRDEWLEPADAPSPAHELHADPRGTPRRFALVRDLSEITAGLDPFGRRDGLTFMPEMAAFAGKRLPIVRSLSTVFEHDRWLETPRPIYLLAGAHCSGAITGDDGPCDRACALLWHEDWLVLPRDNPPPPPSS